jgi:hypothetical protein
VPPNEKDYRMPEYRVEDHYDSPEMITTMLRMKPYFSSHPACWDWVQAGAFDESDTEGRSEIGDPGDTDSESDSSSHGGKVLFSQNYY